MKNRFCAALLIAVLTLCLMAGCADAQLPTEAPQPSAAGPVETTPPAALPNVSEPSDQAQHLTAEEAQAIALAHAGFTADQVRHLRTEPELRDRIPHYDVQFHEGHWEYEYEIHAETGAILSFEKDD